MQGFIVKHGQNTGRVGQWQTGITQTRQRVILGQAWVDDRRTISNRARQRDNPGTQAIVQMRCNQSPTGKAKVNPGNTGRSQTQENYQKARQNYDNYVGSVK